jgi:hypothetical protein
MRINLKNLILMKYELFRFSKEGNKSFFHIKLISFALEMIIVKREL